MGQEEPTPPCHYLSGSLFVFDENFQPLKKLRLKEHAGHAALPVENHDSLLIDDSHYILTSYRNTEELHPDTEKPVNLTSLVLQEIKDDTVVFEFDTKDHPELWTGCLKCNWEDVEWQDGVHFNSLVIDPKDNNLILSFATPSSIVKIDRKTGAVLWQLGGIKDMFNLKSRYYFLGQHALSFDKNGNLMMYDNQSPAFYGSKWPGKQHGNSRILKLKLDEKNKRIADIKTQNLDVQSHSMGSVYQLKNPNRYFVSYGSNTPLAAQEIDNKKNVWLSLYFRVPYVSYKVRHENEQPAFK